MSPVLFNLFLNHLLKRVLPELQRRGVTMKYRIGTSLIENSKADLTSKEMKEWGFLYADDLVLISATVEGVHEMVNIFDDVVRKAGMERKRRS